MRTKETQEAISGIIRKIAACPIPIRWRSQTIMPGGGERRSKSRGSSGYDVMARVEYEPGDDPREPRHDLKRPWNAVTIRANLPGVRIHDLRHTYASFGAGGGLGLPIIGRLLGHTHAATTARYAHLDNDPLRRASESIAGRIAAALDGNRQASVVQFRTGK